MLAVAPEARGRGVGQALVQHCLDRSRALGYAGVRMSTMDRMTTAHRVYERLGFTRAPEDDWAPAPGVLLLAYASGSDRDRLRGGRGSARRPRRPG